MPSTAQSSLYLFIFIFFLFIYLFIYFFLFIFFFFFQIIKRKNVWIYLHYIVLILLFPGLLFIPLLLWWGYCKILHPSVRSPLRPSRYLLLNNWAEFYLFILIYLFIYLFIYFQIIKRKKIVWIYLHYIALILLFPYFLSPCIWDVDIVNVSVRHTISSETTWQNLIKFVMFVTWLPCVVRVCESNIIFHFAPCDLWMWSKGHCLPVRPSRYLLLNHWV